MIDLRSDTVTRPSPGMRRAIAEAEVGDDVFGDDPTVNRLEAVVAERLGKQAALFVPSGTQSNLCALMAHCGRGDEYIAGESAHTYRYEAGGGAVLGSIQPQPVRMFDDGLPDPDHIAAVIKPDDSHFARTKLLCLENTKDGMVQSIERMKLAVDVGHRHGLALHLDGARMWNAIVALGVSADDFVAPFDTVSMCLSKGLGTPVGSVLSGSSELIAEARRVRKMLGGGLRQAGMLAAAGLYALDHNIDRLADDHARAEALAAGLGAIPEITVTSLATNMVFIDIEGASPELQNRLEDLGVLARVSSSPARLATHLDISDDDVEATIEAFGRALSVS